MLKVGDQIPDLGLASTKGKKVVLYFYPKDDTPGCTKEACEFRDNKSNFEDLNVVIVGVSKDAKKSHEKFISKYKLPFVLISDEEGKLLDAFGVWKEKSIFGRSFMGIIRSTFLIDENGKIIKVWPKVKVTGHIEEVLEEIRNL